MTREDLAKLVDACRDGQLELPEAERLAAFMQEHPDDAQWVARELELAGLISQALDKTEPADVLRGFTERIEADASASSFSRDTVSRAIASSAAGDSAGLTSVARNHAMSVALNTRTPANKSKGSGRKWLPTGLIFLAVLLAGLIGLYVWQPWTSATLWSVSPGVQISREEQRFEATAQMALQPGDRIEVPPGGEAILGYRDGGHIALAQRTALLFEPGTVPVYGELRSRHRRFFLESGSITVTQEKKSDLVIYSPHVKAEVEEGILDVSVTLSSSRVAARLHAARLTHNQGGLVETLPVNTERVVTGPPNRP